MSQNAVCFAGAHASVLLALLWLALPTGNSRPVSAVTLAHPAGPQSPASNPPAIAMGVSAEPDLTIGIFDGGPTRGAERPALWHERGSWYDWL